MPSRSAEPHEYLKLIFGVLASLLNGILLAAMFKDRKKIFVTRISYLVANLAIADCLTGLTLIFIEPEILRHKDTPQPFLENKLPITWTPMTISFLTLFLMSAERLVVVALPMIWTRILTPRRTVICIIIIWCLAFLGGYCMKKDSDKTQLALTLAFEFSALFFVGIHIYILWVLRRRERQLVTQTESLGSPTGVSPDLPASSQPPQFCSTAHSKVTAVVAILVVVLILTFFPHFVCLQIWTLNRVTDLEITVDPEKYTLAYNYSDAFSYLNFVVNPIVYAWRLRMYRRAFSGLFHCNASGD